MTQEKISELVEENMKTIFAYALSRVSPREDAEDLAGDIILAILQSGPRIRDENAFFGYIWAIAANTCKKYLRRKYRCQYETLDEELASGEDFTREILKSEEFNILRRELALLSQKYRECTVAYYFEGLSCSETASKLHISLEMVKYYLFKTRKILKEGISMEREFGQKSYQPAPFTFCTIFSGMANEEYQNLFNRRLPGNILLSAYYTPMTIRQLAIELGVASAYLEDEIALLEKYHLLTALPGGKYQTNLIIFTEEYRNEFYRKAEKSFCADVKGVLLDVKKRLPEIRAAGFTGAELDDNRLLWDLLFHLEINGWNQFKATRGEAFQEDTLYGNATGVRFGIAVDKSEPGEYDTASYAGYCSINGRYAATYAEFGILPPKNRVSAYSGKIEEILQGCPDKAPELAIPTFNQNQKKALDTVLAKDYTAFARLFESLYSCALSVMNAHVPDSMTSAVGKVTANSLLSFTAGLIGVCAVKSEALILPEPDDDTLLGIFIYETVCP